MRYELLVSYLRLRRHNRTTARRRFEERDVDGQSFDALYFAMLSDVVDLIGVERLAELIDAHAAIDEHVQAQREAARAVAGSSAEPQS